MFQLHLNFCDLTDLKENGFIGVLKKRQSGFHSSDMEIHAPTFVSGFLFSLLIKKKYFRIHFSKLDIKPRDI